MNEMFPEKVSKIKFWEKSRVHQKFWIFYAISSQFADSWKMHTSNLSLHRFQLETIVN